MVHLEDQGLGNYHIVQKQILDSDNFNNETLAAWAQTQGSISSPNSFLGVRKIKNIN